MFRTMGTPMGHPAVGHFVEHQQIVVNQVRDALFHAQRTMEEYENQKRKDVDFVVGQRVFLNTKNLSGIHFKRKEEKLHERYCGPFPIVERVGPYTYRLELPKSMARLHPVFHVPGSVEQSGRQSSGIQTSKRVTKFGGGRCHPKNSRTFGG